MKKDYLVYHSVYVRSAYLWYTTVKVKISLVYTSWEVSTWEPGRFVMMHWCRAAQQQRTWDPGLEEPPIHPRISCATFSKLFQCKIYFPVPPITEGRAPSRNRQPSHSFPCSSAGAGIKPESTTSRSCSWLSSAGIGGVVPQASLPFRRRFDKQPEQALNTHGTGQEQKRHHARRRRRCVLDGK